MNEKKVACLLLVFIIAGVVYGTQVMQKSTAAIMAEKESAHEEFMTAETDCFKQEAGLKRRTEETRDLQQFLKAWTPVISRFQSGQETEQEILKTIKNSNLLTLSQKFEIRENRGSTTSTTNTTSNTLVPKAFLASLTVQDDFAKTLNWLGELERKIPVARITGCNLKKGDTGSRVTMDIQLEVPLINLQSADAKKKSATPAPKS